MIPAAPQTISVELMDKICDLQVVSNCFLDKNEFKIARLLADIRKLATVDAYAAHIAYGAVHQLCGDVEQMRDHFKNAAKIGNVLIAEGQSTIGEINVGFASVAQELYRRSADPTGGYFTKTYHLAKCCGAFQMVRAFTERAKEMKIDLADINTDENERVATLLAEAGVSDADVATMLDLAGEVLREERIFPTGEPEIEVDDDSLQPCVYYRYSLPASPADTAKMFDRLAYKIATRLDSIPDAFHVSFRPAH